MAKTMKSFRLSQVALLELQELRELYPDWNETEIVQKAIDVLNMMEICPRGHVRSMSGARVMFNTVFDE